MNRRPLSDVMWNQALAMLSEADRLHRQFFRAGPALGQATWEPPIDVVETGDALQVQIALPGVEPQSIRVEQEPDAVVVSALRGFVAGCDASGGARIHRVEIPHGRFVRRIALPMRVLEAPRSHYAEGCLTLTFTKRAAPRRRETA